MKSILFLFVSVCLFYNCASFSLFKSKGSSPAETEIIKADSAAVDTFVTTDSARYQESINGIPDSLRGMAKIMFPNGLRIIADEPLPNDVLRARNNMIIVAATGRLRQRFGIGSIVSPGIIVTAAHLADSLDVPKEKVSWRGFTVSDSAFVQIPMWFLAQGKENTFEDIALLKVNEKFMESAKTIVEEKPSHPYRIFFNTMEFADTVYVGEKVFISILSQKVQLVKYLKNWPFPIPIPVSVNDFTFSSRVLEKIEKPYGTLSDMLSYTLKTIVLSNMKSPYIADDVFEAVFRPLLQLRKGLPGSHSGAPVFNSKGQIAGMVIFSDKIDFSYAISAKVMKNFLRKHGVLE